MTDTMSETDLQALAERGAAELGEHATAQELLSWTDENFGAGTSADYIVASNMQDAVLVDLEAAMDALGEVTGRTMREDITNRIFERFCVGK